MKGCRWRRLPEADVVGMFRSEISWNFGVKYHGISE